MGMTIGIIVTTAVLFLSMILLLAAKPKFAGRLTGTFLVIAGVSGLLFYGCGFAATIENPALATIRSLLAVCGMFVAKMDIGAISAAPFMQHEMMQLLFWIVHLMALYATASAAITTVGAEALRKLRLWLARWGQLHLIYGVSDTSLELGKTILSRKEGTVVFIDGKPDSALAAAIGKAGCVLRSDNAALRGDGKFLRSVGLRPGKRKVTLYAMESQSADSLGYATNLLQAMKEGGITPEQTSLVIRGQEDSAGAQLQVLGDRYGYGYVTVIQEASLAARLLIRNYPPCDSISFDENALAREDFEALILGFGQMGQTVLRHLAMHGQFAGSTFRAAVFAPDCESTSGFFRKSYEQLLCQYPITFHPYDARSSQLYEYLAQRGENLKYIVICTGSDQLNHELAGEIQAYLDRLGHRLSVYLCSRREVAAYSPEGKLIRRHKLYDPENLSVTGLDRMAMILNHSYQKDSTRSELENWMHCDYFSRMSCRAMTDFSGAMVRMAGCTREQVLEQGWDLSPQQMENLARTEHERWNAFHFAMGFSPMTPEEYDAREAQYLQQKAAGETPTIRVGKNMKNRTHACLISWEELEALSERESKATGRPVDYHAMDMDNVLAVPQLLRSSR